MGDLNENPQSKPVSSPSSRALVLAFRILLLLAAVGLVVAATVIGTRSHALGESAVRYVCPMHPEVTSASPGQCPICRMELEPVKRGSAANDSMAMGDMTAVDNVRAHKIVDFARRRSLLSTVQELRGPASVGDDGAISAIFYDDQIDSLAPDEAGVFFANTNPGVTYGVQRSAGPSVKKDASTSEIRFVLKPDPKSPTQTSLAPGTVGWLQLAPKARDVLTVPASAILQSPEGPYVLTVKPGFKLEKRSIRIGETYQKQGFAIVLSGLERNERVVSRAAFFMDADRRLASQAAETSLTQ